MSWIDTYDATFFLAVGSIVLSALTLSIKYCLKSKCEHFTLFWGLVKIDRRVDLETQIDLKEIEGRETEVSPTTPSSNTPSSNI